MPLIEKSPDHKIAHGRDVDEVMDMLIGADDSMTRCLGRLIATGMTDTIDNWVAAEAEAGTKPVDMLTAYLNYNLSIFARIALCCVAPGGEAQLVKAMQTYAENLPEIMEGYRNPITELPVAPKPLKKGISPWLTQES